jgi:putative acetyltransferase
MGPTFKIRHETPQDRDAIASVHEDAFGVDEPIPALVDALRLTEGSLPVLSLVAEAEDKTLIGHVMLTHSWLDAPKRLVDVMVLSPLGVRSSLQKQGVGKALLDAATKAAETAGAPLVFLEGNPAYYRHRGFKPAIPMGFLRPSLRIPEGAFQVFPLAGYTSEMTGTLVYRDVFWALDCVGLRKA